MVSEDIISLLKLAHGSYNSALFLGFLVQATLGLRIRAARRKGSPNTRIIIRHRKFGPVLTVFGIFGGISGPIITYLDKGQVIKYPLHLIGGLTVVVLILLVFMASRLIKGQEPGPRTIHLSIGIVLLIAYMIQAVFGLGILL